MNSFGTGVVDLIVKVVRAVRGNGRDIRRIVGGAVNSEVSRAGELGRDVAAPIGRTNDGFATTAANLMGPRSWRYAPITTELYDWTGGYVGGHVGLAFGKSGWIATAPVAPSAAGLLDMYQSPNAFYESGSWLVGVQGGYNYMLPSRVVVGIEADATFPTFQDLFGQSTGGITGFTAPTLGAVTYREMVLSSGTVRARIGYAPGNWLFYATGGFAWTYDQQKLTQVASGSFEAPLVWRFGWAAGVGVEIPLAPSWTVKGEYLWTGFPMRAVNYPASGQLISSDLSLQQLRLGLNYRVDDPSRSVAYPPSRFTMGDIFAVHGQKIFTEQAYPSFRSPYEGTNSLGGTGQGPETFDATLSIGLKLWEGADFWANPEIDQGFGFNNTHGVAGFPSAESYKLGWTYPYARVQRAFVRQTINLGGDVEQVDNDFTQFAGTRSTDRLVLTAGRFGIADIFDTNRYANNPKSDFLNWSVINAGTFDYAGDGWGYTYGAAAEWYTGRWTLRAGVFDLSNTPAGGTSPTAYALDPTFQQFQIVGEIEGRHELWGLPGKIKLTGFVSRGRAGNYDAAVTLAQASGQPADINAVRSYNSRPGVSINFEQQVTDAIGVFGRAGWAHGNVEPWNFIDIDRTVQLGVSINGKGWGRPDDTIGVVGVVNGISSQHVAFLNAGGLGILIGDGQLPNYGLERIFEAYYSYALNASTRLSIDYQFIANPAYNADRGPVNVFSGRVHWQF